MKLPRERKTHLPPPLAEHVERVLGLVAPGELHYKRTRSLAEVAELLGGSKRVAAEHYVYALTDYREAEYPSLR